MTDLVLSRFVKEAANYVTDSYASIVSKVPYANQIIKAGLFASSPMLSVGSHLYQMTKTGVSLGSMATALVDTAIRGYALPFATRASAEIISNVTGLNAELLNIPAQIGVQALYTKAKNYLVNEVTDKNGNTALIQTVTSDNAEAFNALIQAGANPNLQNESGYTALMLAHDIEIIEALIQAGANLNLQNQWGNTKLIQAIKFNNAKAVNALIQAGANLNLQNNSGETALIVTIIENNNAEAFNALIQAGANPNLQHEWSGNTALMMAIIFNNTKAVNALIQTGANLDLQNNKGETALMLAAQWRKIETIKALIQAGADSTSALRKEASEENWAMVNILIHAGANPNIAINNKNDTLLIDTVRKGKIGTFLNLIKAGVDVNITNNQGYTALAIAIFENQPVMAECLIQAGANLNRQNDHGNTALMCAAKNGDTRMTKALIQAGADITLMNNEGDTALMLADKKSNDEVTFSILSVMKLPEINAAVQAFPELNRVVNRFKETVLHVKDNMFQTLRALVQNAPMKGDDFSSNLVNLPLEIKTVILSHMNYPVWYARKERDLSLQSFKVTGMIADRQASDAKKILHPVEQKRRIFTEIKAC